MSKSKLRRISLREFLLILNEAKKYHALKSEPIPEVSDTEHFQIVNCLKSPFQMFDGRALYPGIHKKAAMMFYLLIKNHPLKNGNKRLAILTTWWFYLTNGYHLRIRSRNISILEAIDVWDSDNYIYKLAMKTVNSKSDDKDVIVSDIEKNFIKFAKHRRD